MNRRTFTKLTATGLALSPSATLSAAPPAAGRMKLGTQNQSSDEMLRILAALGVSHTCAQLPSAKFDETWSVEGLRKLRERVESFGIRLEAVPLPLSSSYITKSENPNIMLGKSPERDQEIDNICHMIENAANVGIPILKYNMTILGVVRSGRTPGRGGCSYSTFDYEKTPQEPPLTEAGPVSAEMMWDRIAYFLKRVIPVAEQNKVKMACHPHDPGMPADKGFRGIHRVLGSVDGLKRFVEINPSPYHGINFCQGTVCGNAQRSEPRTSGCDPLFWQPQEDFQRAFP